MCPMLLHYKCLSVGINKLQFRYIVLVSASYLLKCNSSVSRGILGISFCEFFLTSGKFSASFATRYIENLVWKVKCGASDFAPTARFWQRLYLQRFAEICSAIWLSICRNLMPSLILWVWEVAGKVWDFWEQWEQGRASSFREQILRNLFQSPQCTL